MLAQPVADQKPSAYSLKMDYVWLHLFQLPFDPVLFRFDRFRFRLRIAKMFVYTPEGRKADSSHIKTSLGILNFGFRELKFSNKITNRIICKTKADKEIRERMQTVNYFGNILFVVKISEFEYKDL